MPLLIPFLLFLSLLSQAQAATRTAATTSQADVQAQVTASAPGDTVIIPAGSSTWAGGITLSRGIIIAGAGVGNTNLTKTNGDPSGAVFNVSPSATALANDETFKITGISFLGGNTSLSLIVVYTGGVTTKPLKNLIIGDCRFANTGGSTSGAGTIYINGQVRGVIYNNTFDRCGFVLRVLGNDDKTEWTNGNFPFAYFNSDNLFFENNTIMFSSSFTGGEPGWSEVGQGGRLCCRYNSYNYANTTYHGEVWDIHGFQNWPGGQTGTMISEYYGNTLTNAGGSGTPYSVANHRGSWGMFHNNIYTNHTGAININQYDLPSEGGSGCDAVTGVTGGQVNNTYTFNCTRDGVAINMVEGQIGNGCGVSENNGYWNFNPSFNGTTGIGRGAAPPTTAFPTCTKGVGYWQNASPNPTSNPTIIQAGHFWKATANNTWTDLGSPYTYPHPLRGGAPPPTPPTLNTATVSPAGNQLILVFSETVQAGSGGSGGWTLTPSATLGTVTGVGSNTLTYNITRTINAGETLTLNYTQPGSGIESVTTGIDLGSISNRAVINSSTQGVTAVPVITLPAGPYFGTQTTTITQANTGSGAVIRYTTDGSTPSASSPVYSTPLSIQTNQTIKAFSIWSGHPDSTIASSAYEVVSWVCPPSPKTFQVPPQAGTFTWNFSITAPAAAGLTSIGIGPAPIATTGDMACIVQFSGNTINAINGGTYTTGPAYSPGVVYNFVASVNVTAHTWTCTVTPAAGGTTSTIVTNAAFRTEQAAAANVSYVGLLATTGSFTAANMSFPSGASSARYIGLRGVPAAGGAVP